MQNQTPRVSFFYLTQRRNRFYWLQRTKQKTKEEIYEMERLYKQADDLKREIDSKVEELYQDDLISTVFGRDAFQDYINRQIQNGDLVKIKNRDIKSSERYALIAQGYGEDASTEDTVAQKEPDVKQNSLSEEAEAPVYGSYNVSGKDIALETQETVSK